MKHFFYTLSVLLLISLFSCDEMESEINLGNNEVEENPINFEVEFNGTIFTTKKAEASIIDGVTIIKATDEITNEVFIIELNRDVVGDFTFTPNDYVGNITYRKDVESSFYTSPYSYSGRVDLTQIDETNATLFGNFSFSGIQLIPVLDDEGNPVTDEYTTRIRSFTNGVFTHIPFSRTEGVSNAIEDLPSDNTFTVKIDDTEYMESSISAEKTMVDTTEVIQIVISNNDAKIEFQIPALTITTEQYTLDPTNTDPVMAKITYTTTPDIGEEVIYTPTEGEIETPILTSIKHNTNTNRMDISFAFTGKNNLDETLNFTEGRISVTYTE